LTCNLTIRKSRSAALEVKSTAISRVAGLPPITLHGLRHGAASLALAAGTNVKVVSDKAVSKSGS
jgi:integrase